MAVFPPLFLKIRGAPVLLHRFKRATIAYNPLHLRLQSAARFLFIAQNLLLHKLHLRLLQTGTGMRMGGRNDGNEHGNLLRLS